MPGELESLRVGTREMLDSLSNHELFMQDAPHTTTQASELVHYEATAGRPRLVIDHDLLAAVSGMAEPSALGRLLPVQCSGRTIRRKLLQLGLSLPGPSVMLTETDSTTGEPNQVKNAASTGRLPKTHLSDDELDSLVGNIVQRFEKHGRVMIHGQLQAAGHHVPMDRVRKAITRVLGMPASFGRQVILRRQYAVAGPDSLWHHDGQHGKYPCSTTPF
jgi:hypothetical protein